MHKGQKSYPPMKFSDCVLGIPQALSVYINQIVYDLRRRQRDIVALSLGEAFFEIPAFSFRDLDFERGYHYSDSQGIPELRDKIASFYRKQYGAKVDGDTQVLVSAGSKPIIYMAMRAVLNRGDKVVIHEPAWLSYQEQARLCEGEVSFIPFDTPISDFSQYFTENAKMLVINNPNNPSGRIYTREELESLYEQCRSRGVFLLVDEAYSDFIIDGEFHSIATLFPDLDGVIAINSLSKNMGMSGWRIGYAIANQDFIDKLLILNQHLITCAPTILLQYVSKYFDSILSNTLPQVHMVVEKRNYIAKQIDQIGLGRLAGSSTFYFFISVGDYRGDVLELALYLLVFKGVATVPGSAYGASTERFLRVSIGTESEERIIDSLKVIRGVLINGVPEGVVDEELKRLGLPKFQE